MNKASGWRLGRHQFLMVCFGWLLCAHLLAADVASPVPGSHVLVVVTNLLQMHQLLNSERRVTCALHLSGVVCYARPEENAFVLGDDSGAELLYLDWLGNSIKPGQRLLVEGTNCWVVRRDLGVTIDRPPLIDNNGVHGMYEKSGTMHLDAGRHPIRLAWFNGTGVFGLKLECQGPGLPRQPVSDAWLFRAVVDPASGQSRYVHGLDFRCNEGGWWNALPDFDSGNRVKSGVTSNFDLAVRSRDEFVALDFSGYLQVPTDGTYSFYLASDDGSEFFIGKPSHDLKVLGFDSIPKPKPVAIGQLLRPEDDSQWSEIEGMVSFATESQGRMELELKTESGHIRIQIMDFTGFSPTLLQNSRMRVVGVCQSVVTLDGRKIPGTLLVPSWQQVQPMELAPMLWNRYPVQRISSLAEMRPDENGERIAHVQGKVCGAGPGQIRVRDESGSATISITQPQPKPEGLLDILGLVNGEGTNLLINSGCYRETGKPFNTKAGSLPVLTTASQVKELSREDASLGYPVVIRGVVIGLMSGSPSIVIQDATSGIFVRIPEMGRPDPPEIGELWQIEGVTTAGDFAPTLLAQKVTRLDRGRLPEPMRPTWDQLINGSADTQYAEIQGIVTDIQTNTLVLLCRGGKMRVKFPEMDETSLRLYVNKLVRIRGCLLAIWNVETHQVNAGEIQMSNPTISVDVPNSVDLFASTPLKHVADLLRFDLRASAFQPVKVSGQFVRREGKEYYLLDGATGLRFVPKIIPEIQPGECLEVVGLPELGGPSPILHEAQVRKTGMAALPPAIPLQPQELNRPGLDATRVTIQATLVNLQYDQAEQVFEMQVGFRGFVAIMPAGSPGANFPIGSQLAMTGVYVSLGSDQVLGLGSESFKLLLNSPTDIKVLSRPAWWTLRRVLITLGLLVGVLVLAAGWITQLHRQVAERSLQLEGQIHKRQRLEYEGKLEGERTRIARDLHDELGADLTEISMLAQDPPEQSPGQLGRVSELIRNLVVKLDEVVWAVDPTMDNTVSLANYLTGFAEEFLNAARVNCRIRMPATVPEWPVSAHVRHQLFLAVKEALNNAVRHGRAKEVMLQIDWKGNTLEVTIQDQGLGFDPSLPAAGHGLRNFQDRLAGIKGRCSVASEPGKGTTVQFFLSLDQTTTKDLPKASSPP